MINKTVIKCPYCMSTNLGVVAENATGDFGECYCSNCHKNFALTITSEEIDGVLTEVHTCCEKVGRSSEDYEEEIGRLKYDKEQLLLAIENLNKTINILTIQIIRKG